ncbi:hypothetical protein [Pleomorphomonas oryzae]|uniref:hypothetical protein n=1 Tax=Pleomorphomonas oryzae TaxID=261934 RepID=UPI0003F8D6F7|nr:hypothetical protein [Pleomorphomonas oryzae]
MDEAQFQDLVDRQGEDLTRWPEALRVEAELLLAVSEPARRILGNAVTLRAAFASARPIRAPRDLAARILALTPDDDSASSS